MMVSTLCSCNCPLTLRGSALSFVLRSHPLTSQISTPRTTHDPSRTLTNTHEHSQPLPLRPLTTTRDRSRPLTFTHDHSRPFTTTHDHSQPVTNTCGLSRPLHDSTLTTTHDHSRPATRPLTITRDQLTTTHCHPRPLVLFTLTRCISTGISTPHHGKENKLKKLK